MNHKERLAASVASKERCAPSAMPYAKLKLVASMDDPAALHACVAAKAAGIDLAVEVAPGGGH